MRIARKPGPVPVVSAEARDEFAARVPERVERARRALQQLESGFGPEHAETLYAAAHDLSGMAARGGAQAFREAAAQLETVARSWIGRGATTDVERRHARAALARVAQLAGGFEGPKPPSNDAAPSLAARLTVLHEISALGSPGSDTHRIFSGALVALGRVLDFQRASVVLADDSGETYSVRALYDKARGGLVERHDSFALSRGIAGEVIRSGVPTRVDALAANQEIPIEPGERGSALSVPLRLEDRVIGALNFSRDSGGAYGDDDLGLAIAGAQQIACALQLAKLQDALEEQHDQLDTVVGTSTAAVMLVNDERRIARTNEAMAALLGVPKETLVHAMLADVRRLFLRLFATPEALDAQERALAEHRAIRDRVELVFPHPAVHERVVAPVPANRGSRTGWILSYRDVSHEAAVEQAKSQFVSLVSHELRTPVTAISSSLSLLSEQGGAVSSAARELVDIALRNTDRLIVLINDLLDVSHRGARSMELDVAPLDLADVIRSSVDAVATFAREQQVRIDVTPPAEPVLVLGMRDRIEQVMVHLLANAIKFSPRDAAARVSWKRDADGAVIEVADNGPGIPDDQREIIFEPFRQLDSSSTREHEGAGLGLTISRDIVRAHGGELWVESAVGSGSRFLVRLPLAPPEAGAATPPPSAAADAGPAPGTTVLPPLVLIAHSDRDWQHLARARANAEGWRVTSTETGAAALEQLRRERADLVVLGLELSDMHGLEVLQQIQLDPALFDTPVVLAADVDARSLGDEGTNGGSGVATTAEDVIERARRLLTEPPRQMVLVIEDDPLLRPAVGKIVRRAGYACLTVANARDALDFIRRRVPDVVITDYRMPEMNGVKFLEELRKLPEARGTHAIMLTGHVTPELARQVGDLSAKLLSKPVEATELVTTIRQML
ncbi:MAG TPA: response regulator [Gemmatimonadales bacterium]|nr:response regulator [Gemmatimonadales bacterium]